MLNLKKMQGKVDKLMSVFTNIVKELDTQVETLEGEIESNNLLIADMKSCNEVYKDKIAEYTALKSKVEAIVK